MNKINFKDMPMIISQVLITTAISILMFYGIQYIIYDSRDVNRDGEINAQDYVEIKNYIMEEDE